MKNVHKKYKEGSKAEEAHEPMSVEMKEIKAGVGDRSKKAKSAGGGKKLARTKKPASAHGKAH